MELLSPSAWDDVKNFIQMQLSLLLIIQHYISAPLKVSLTTINYIDGEHQSRIGTSSSMQGNKMIDHVRML